MDNHNLINVSSILGHLLFLVFHFYKSYCNEHLCRQLSLIIFSGWGPRSGIIRSG